MTDTATTALTVSVYAVTAGPDHTPDYARPQHVTVSAVVADQAEAEALVSIFPKSANLRAATLRRFEAEPVGYVDTYIRLLTDGVNGGANETGIKRLRAILKHAAARGLAVEYVAAARNSYPTLEAALEAIDAQLANA